MTAIAPQTAGERSAPALASAPAVSVRELDKTFRLPHRRYNTLKERVLHPFASQEADELRALRDVSFDVAPGEFFGIVGKNGSGKSTLLKCLAGIYSADRGELEVRGRLSPFIELGVGFNAEMTARDNVIINAIMLGLSRKQARARFDEIIEFAELEEFVDLKLKNYSSGMSVRLGFAVAIQVDADVLLVDEVLAVGDAAFQQKCFDEFNRMKADGRTVLFVTHDMASVRHFCDRAMLIDRGKTIGIGDPEDISLQYSEINFGHTVHDEGKGADAPVRIIDAWVEDGGGERVVGTGYDQPLVACMEVEFREAISDPDFAITFRNDARHTIFVASTSFHGTRSGSFKAGQTATVRFAFRTWLAASRYTLTPSVATSAGESLDRRDDLTALVISTDKMSGGVADIPVHFEVERA